MNCSIIEDDKNTVKILEHIIQENYPNITVKGSASSILEGIQLVETSQPDFILLDVNLDDGEGFEILKSFPSPNFKIIFITSYSKYAIEAFKFSALDFVLKPFTPIEIIDAIDKVIEEKNQTSYIEKIATLYHNHISENKKIILSNSEDIHVVAIDDILYAESDNSYTTVFTRKNTKILISKSLKSFEKKLAPYLFFRIHQKYLINLKYVTRYHKKNDSIVLLNNTSLPVSKGKKEHLLQFLKNL